MKNRINKIKIFLKDNKGFTLSLIFIVFLLCYVAIPTLSEYNNASPMYTLAVWDGSISSSYSDGSGTKDDPYVISNGSDLLYFVSQLEINNYDGEYFILNNDIVLNDGIFNYSENGEIKYVKNNIENIIEPNIENDIINEFQQIDGFKGNFDGNFHTIYGLYIDESLDGQNGLFTNLEGNISNLYVKNSLIYGGKIVGGIASKSVNSEITNVTYDGFVVSDDELSSNVVNLELDDVSRNVLDLTLSDNINISGLGYVYGIINSIKLTGIYQTDNSNSVLKINNEVINEGEFQLILDNDMKNIIPLFYQTDVESNFSLTNLKYEINFSYSNASGIVSIADNTSLKNVINKAYVKSQVYASGIVNVIDGKTSFSNVYNTGIIESNSLSSGLVSTINQNSEEVIISNCYNDGLLKSDNNVLLGDIYNNTGSITLNNIFNTRDEYVINLIDDSKVYVNKFYIISDKGVKTGVVDGSFVKTTLEELNKKNFIQTYLGYDEYVGLENVDNGVWVWLFEDDSLPILYIDELNRPIANIHVKEYVWNDYKKDIKTLNFSDKLVFSIEEVSMLNPIKEVYYYISNEKRSFTKSEIDAINDWENYDNIIEISDEGFYVIYAKIIDNSNNVIYVNSDLLLLDLTGANIKIMSSFDDDVWENFNSNVNKVYVNDKVDISIQADDSISGIDKIYYYLSDTVLSIGDMESELEWVEYNGVVSINSGKTILYAKVLNDCNYVTYANTDLFVMNGYVLNTLSLGMNGISSDELNISDDSSVSLNFIYEDDNEYDLGGKHQLISNIILPENTRISIIDKIKNKVYVYTTNNDDYGYNDCLENICEAKYDFELFNEVGSKTLFNESDYTGKINENFVILVDFKNALINEDINDISLKLKLNNDNKNEIRDTLVYSYKKFNIYKDSGATFSLISSFNDTINYNENYQYIIDFSTKINYKNLEDKMIFDSTFEDKNFGLSIKMIDINGNVVNKRNLKNIVFKFGDKKYSPNNSGIVKINLDKGMNDITDNLIIQTYSDNYELESGDYKFVITLYAAYDGMYSNENLANIEIPVYVGENSYNNDTSFNVLMDDDDKIIVSKENEFNFEFLVSDITDNTSIKMSLYKKISLSPYDQKYTIINLGDYIINNNLEMAAENIYYASKTLSENNNLKINLNTDSFDKNGYMFVFELYDGERLVSKINRKFIVK